MGHDDRREIYERLEALERMARGRGDERGGWDHERRHGHRDHGRDRHHHRHEDCHHDHSGSEGFDEKRVIDTIVHLVSERVAHMLDERLPHGRDEAGGEKRIVDLIVGLVSEHVSEIVRSELDRRLGNGKGEGDGPSGAAPSEAHEPR